MKTRFYIILMFLSVPMLLAAQQDKPTSFQSKAYYQNAKQEIEQMLNGQQPLSYEKAIYLIENAWYDGQINYAAFQSVITSRTDLIKQIVEQRRRTPEKPKSTTFFDQLREYNMEKEGYYDKALANWGIYSYMVDTAISFTNKEGIKYFIQRTPFSYSTNDPLGSTYWTNTQVTNLFLNGKGNCFALVSLFKIFSERLNTDAKICTAPGHVYICHKDDKGREFNVEIASKAFPGIGTLSTLTHTTQAAIENDISLRQLDLKQSVALCLVYLAKGYEHKFHLKEDDGFIMACANSALKFDSLNLNAMLLKADILQAQNLKTGKTIAQLQNDKTFIEYERLISHLYKLGYREMPLNMKNILIKGWMHDTVSTLAAVNYRLAEANENNNTPATRKASLSWGLFDEEITDKPMEKYGRAVYNTKSKKITKFVREDVLYNDYNFDPVLFALSVDPMAHKMPSISPYAFCANNPIANIDPDGALPWSFHIRSFIAAKSVAGGSFRGDGRGPSLATDKSVTSRVRSSIVVDPAKQTIIDPTTAGDPTVFYGSPTPLGYLPPDIKIPKPKASIDEANYANNFAWFKFSHSAKDPVTPQWATPALDVHATISVREDLDNGILTVRGEFTGDEFPSTEAFVVDQSGKVKVFLGAKKEHGGISDLFGDNKKPLFNLDIEIKMDKKGNFTGVKEGGKEYSVDDWNKQVKGGFK